jgi:hypothetical protein
LKQDLSLPAEELVKLLADRSSSSIKQSDLPSEYRSLTLVQLFASVRNDGSKHWFSWRQLNNCSNLQQYAAILLTVALFNAYCITRLAVIRTFGSWTNALTILKRLFLILILAEIQSICLLTLPLPDRENWV